MSKVHIHSPKGFTMVQNDCLHEKNMSAKARGLFSIMMSLPPDWDFSVVGLAALMTDGKHSINEGLHELEEGGYLVRERLRVNGRVAGIDYHLYPIPQKKTPVTDFP